MKAYEVTPTGLRNGLPITVGNNQAWAYVVRLGEQVSKVGRRLSNSTPLAEVHPDLFALRDHDRVPACDIFFGQQMRLMPEHGSPSEDILVLIWHVAPTYVSFTTEGSCEILMECSEREHVTGAGGRSILVRMSPNSAVMVLEAPRSGSDPKLVRRIMCDAEGKPTFESFNSSN